MENEKKLYPLTPAQQVIQYNLKFSFKQAVVNICTMLHFDCDIDEKLMLEATKKALERNVPASTRVVVQPDKTHMQYFTDEPVKDIEVIDYSRKSQKALDKLIRKMSTTAFPNKSIETQLYNVKLIRKPDGKSGLYFCVSHLAFDAYALMYMAGDIVNIYVALRDGTEMPKNKYRTVEAYEKVYELDKSEQKQKDIKFWHDEIFNTEPHYSSVEGVGTKRWINGKNYGKTVDIFRPQAKHINKTLKKETVDKINAFAAEHKVSPQVVYCLAYRSYLSKMSGYIDDIMILNNLARRATILEKNAGGTFVQAIPMRMNISNDLSFEDACNELQAIQFKMFAHTLPSSMEYIESYESQYKKPPICGYASASMTFQPYAVKGHESVPVHLSVYSNGYNSMALYLTVMALDNSGDLNFNYDYNTALTHAENVEKMHEHMLKFFDKAIENPKMTLRQLMDL